MRRVIAVAGILLAIVGTAGCSKRQIDTDESGGFPIAGTAYYGFCRGTTLMMWVPSMNADEIDVVHYNDPDCMHNATEYGPTDTGNIDDPDGVIDE